MKHRYRGSGRGTVRAVVAVGLAVLATTVAASPVAAGPVRPATADATAGPAGPVPGGFASWRDLMAMQERLNDAAATITAAAAKTGSGTGLAGIVADPESRRLRLHWKGAVPAEVSAIVTTVRGRIPVDVVPARHSEAELLAAARQVAVRPGVHTVAPNVDGSGLTARVSGQPSDVAAASLTELGVPVRVEQAPAPTHLLGKSNDSAPYYGAGLWSGSAGWCSTGFAVKHQNIDRMLSAGHCGANGDTARDGGGDVMGSVVSDNDVRDTLMIATISIGTMFTGAFDSATSRPVSGSSASLVGNVVCRSSALSNETCRIKVTRVNVSVGGNSPMVEAEQLDRVNAAGQGDSGGSVFAYNSANNKVTAYGTISSGDSATPVACTGVTGRQCFWRIYYADIAKTLAHYGATLQVS